MSRIELWSCGGGRQSAGIAALIKQGRLTKPDHAVFVELEWEVKTTMPYLRAWIIPFMESIGVPFTIIQRKEYATRGFWGGADRSTLLLPAYTNQSGEPSKLDEFCSGEWKREVVKRWASKQPGWKDVGVYNWVGISWEERKRRRSPRLKWIQPSYPLLDVVPIHVSALLKAVEDVGWPEPPRSRCSHCPNQSDAEWASITPEEWEAACKLDEAIRQKDPNAFLHKQMIPLRMVELKPEEDNLFTGGCTSGTCY